MITINNVDGVEDAADSPHSSSCSPSITTSAGGSVYIAIKQQLWTIQSEIWSHEDIQEY